MEGADPSVRGRWRVGILGKSNCSSKGPGFSSQHPLGVSPRAEGILGLMEKQRDMGALMFVVRLGWLSWEMRNVEKDLYFSSGVTEDRKVVFQKGNGP